MEEMEERIQIRAAARSMAVVLELQRKEDRMGWMDGWMAQRSRSVSIEVAQASMNSGRWEGGKEGYMDGRIEGGRDGIDRQTFVHT